MPDTTDTWLTWTFGTTPDGSCGGSEGYTCGVIYGNCCGKDNKCGGSKTECGTGWYVVLAIVPLRYADGLRSVNPILENATPLARLLHPTSLQMEVVVVRRDTSARIPRPGIAAHIKDIAAQLKTTAQPDVNQPLESALRLNSLSLFGTQRLEVRMPPPCDRTAVS
jgi:hypothetical protein